MAFALGEDRDKHVGPGNLLASRRLDVDHGTLDDALKVPGVLGIMTAAASPDTKKNPTDAEIKDALAGLKCRCGTHTAIMRAVKRAADSMA